MEQKSKKKYFIAALAVLLVAVAVGGTIAWLNSASHLTNSFTVGDVNDPTTEPGNPGEPIDPNNPDNPQVDNLDGNLYEPSWVDNSKIMPGNSIAKDPYVGIGDGSESAYVFIYVDNNTMSQNGSEKDDAPYFVLNGNWAAVKDSDGTALATNAVENSVAYTSGLFMYSTDETSPVLLEGLVDKDNWTVNPIFSRVTTPKNAEASDFAESPTIDVKSYVIVTNSPAEATEAAIDWYEGFTQQP